MKISAWKPDVKNAWVSFVRIGFGQLLYFCFVPNFAGPVGFVWGIGHGAGKTSRFEVYGSYVIPSARRNGVRTRLNTAIHEHFRCITTMSGSREGGLAFLKSQGYKFDPRTTTWFLERKA